jgi:hypothetical protein
MTSHTPRQTTVRAPQPVAVAPHSAAHVAPHAVSVTYSPNAALLIDFDNVTMGIRSDLQTELKNLLASDIIKGKVQLRRAYADWRRYPQYVAPLAEASIDMIMAPAYGSSKKNATDIRLAIDALELVFTRPEIGTYILLSGDSDFSTLVIKLKEYGKYVIGVGIRESSSDLLVMNCDEYYSYNALAGLVRTGSDGEPAGRRDPWELVTEALSRMQRNGDVMRADRLKQVMQDIDSTFDEKNLGMSKFSRFVTEAAARGLLALTKLDTGQLEVAPPRQTGETAAVPALPAAENGAESAGEERERRRRRDRGRGRGREGREARPEPAPIAGSIAPEAARPVERAVERAVERPVDRPVERAPERVSDGIGISGERLTRDEAFGLVRRAVGALASDDRPARASDARVKAREMLGRDSLSLSPENFTRILRDAHDADVIDLRRRGDDYEVAPAVTAAPVAEQLNVAAAATTRAEAPSTTAAPGPVAPRGVGSRGIAGGRRQPPPPELLNVGVVDLPVVIAAPVAVAAPAAAVAAAPAAAPASRPAAKRSRAKKTASEGTPKAKTAARAKTSRARKTTKSTDA